MEGKDDKSFKRDIIVLISFPVLFVSTSFLVNIGKEMSLPGFRRRMFIIWFIIRTDFSEGILRQTHFLCDLKCEINFRRLYKIIILKSSFKSREYIQKTKMGHTLYVKVSKAQAA